MSPSSLEEQGMPASLEAEQSILGGVLHSNEHFYDDLGDLAEEDFSHDSHRKIFSVMYAILMGLEEGISHVDIVTVMEVLGRRKQGGAVGGTAYIMSLTENLPRRKSLEEYVRIVREKARLRRTIHICNSAITRAVDQSESAQKIAADLQDDMLAEAAESYEEPKRIGVATKAVEDRLNRMRKIAEDSAAAELTWGISELDKETKGAFLGELTVLAGESGGFKTAVATQMVLQNARRKKPCAFFSIEMATEQLAVRFYPQMGSIITTHMTRDPRLINEHTHVPEIRRLSRELESLPIWIDDAPQGINRLIARMKMMRRKLQIELFAIDYLQLITPNHCRTEAEGVKNNIFAIRDFVKSEPGCHVLLLSQFSKSGGFRGKKVKRSKEDLYGSSAVHQAAQNVILINVESAKGKPSNQLLEAEFDIDKQRSGGVAKITTMLDRDFLRFAEAEAILTT